MIDRDRQLVEQTLRIEARPETVWRYWTAVPHQPTWSPDMEIPKPSDADRERFLDLAPDAAGVEVKPMFGNLGAFVNGNMFMGLFGSDVGVKLSDDDREELLTHPGSGPFGPAERPMGGYVTVPADWSTQITKLWIDKALAHVAALPAKTTNKRTAAQKNKKAAKKR